MSLKRRLSKVESAITAEIQEAAAATHKRNLQLCKDLHLPLPETSTDEERAEALARLLSLQQMARAGTATDLDLVEWHRWVDAIHERHNHKPPT